MKSIKLIGIIILSKKIIKFNLKVIIILIKLDLPNIILF